jgi:hypothetical protein
MLPQVKPIVRRVESLKIETALIDSVAAVYGEEMDEDFALV